MSGRPKTRWWNGIPKSEPPPDNVYHMPRPSLDQLENDCREAQNAVVAQGIEVDRAVLAYKTALKGLEEARHRLAERLKESGARIEFTQQFPEPE